MGTLHTVSTYLLFCIWTLGLYVYSKIENKHNFRSKKRFNRPPTGVFEKTDDMTTCSLKELNANRTRCDKKDSKSPKYSLL